MYYIDISSAADTRDKVLQAVKVGYVYGARLQPSGYIYATDAFTLHEVTTQDKACWPFITSMIHCTDGDISAIAFWFNPVWYRWMHTVVDGQMRGDIIASFLGYQHWVMSRASNVAPPAGSVPGNRTYSVIYADYDYNGVKADIHDGDVVYGSQTVDGETIHGSCTITPGSGYAGCDSAMGTNGTGCIFTDQIMYMCDHENMNDIMFARVDDFVTASAQIAANATAVGAALDDIQGLIAANGTIYGVLMKLGIFGSKFEDVVEAYERIGSAGQYIPRP